MNISEFILKLETIKEIHGDLNVVCISHKEEEDFWTGSKVKKPALIDAKAEFCPYLTGDLMGAFGPKDPERILISANIELQNFALINGVKILKK